jgi:nucleobase:cation symporter-1, NCS1 family
MTTATVNGQPEQLVERHTIAPIPTDERHGRPRDLFTIWFASNIMPLTFVTGALASAVYGLSFWWSLLAIAGGNLVGGLFMALHSAQGPRLGVPQMIQSRGQFGYIGAVLVVLIAVIMYVGFFASNLVLGGESFNELTSSVSINWGIVICGVASALITILGYDRIHDVNRYASFAFGAVLLLSFIWIIAGGLPGNFLTKGGFSWGPFMAMLSIVALWQIAYAPYVSDYSRYLPENTGVGPTFWASYWGCNIGSILPMMLGVVVGLASTASDSIVGINNLTGSIGWLVMLVFVLGIMDTNSINLYGGTLCTITVGQTARWRWLPGAATRALLSLVILGIALLIAIKGQANFLTNYIDFVLFLLYLLIPWTAINLVDYYLIRRGNYDVAAFFNPTGGIYGRVNLGALVVYVIGVGVEIPFVNTSFYEGPVAKSLNGADLAWIVGLAVVLPLYYFVARLMRLGAATPAVGEEPLTGAGERPLRTEAPRAGAKRA